MTTQPPTSARKNRFWQYLKTGLKFALRWGLLLVMIGMFLASVAWIVFLKTFNAQRVSEVITTELQTRLQRPVAISSLDLKFINTLELKGFRILDTEGIPGQDLVSAESVTLRFELLPLLKKQLVIDEVSLHAPRFNIVRRADGIYNLPQLKTKNPSVYTDTQSGSRLAVSVENWTLKDGVPAQ